MSVDEDLTAGEDPTVDIDCPDCGVEWEFGAILPTPDGFCTTCDFPMFWTDHAADPDWTATGTIEIDQRRLPGVAGHADIVGAVACWHCEAFNHSSATSCAFCESPLPEPEEPDEPEETVAEPSLCDAPDGPVIPDPWEVPAAVQVALGIILLVTVVVLIVILANVF